MNRTWTVCRQFSPRPDGERRWDQAYQLLVRQAGQGGRPGLPLITGEDADAGGSVRAGLDRSPTIGTICSWSISERIAALMKMGTRKARAVPATSRSFLAIPIIFTTRSRANRFR